jgi:NAD(P)-dependent dehydrogenase (short-subunit alcohol dehydrogenase family)
MFPSLQLRSLFTTGDGKVIMVRSTDLFAFYFQHEFIFLVITPERALEVHMLEKFTLDGRVAVVTGGGGGLGTAISLALANAGAKVVLTDFRVKDGQKTLDTMLKLGHEAAFFQADVTKSAEVNDMMAKAISRWGKVNVLVNCAGIVRPDEGDREPARALWDISDADWHQGIDVNLTGAFYCSRAISKHMVDRQSGAIINIASGWAFRGMRDGFMYCAAKAGVVNLTRSLALTLNRSGIRVNAIAPGLFRTWERKEVYDARGARIPMGRSGNPPEIGTLAVYLASDASGYVTGETFAIDGGTLASGYAPTGYAPLKALK